MLYQTHLRVHLDAIRHNLAGIREAVGPDVAVLLAVKSNGYGHGAVEVARDVERAGLVDRFGVATVPEGIELRGAGVRSPILKLSHAFPEEIDAALAHDLELAVVDAAGADAVAEAALARGVVAPVHLKIDTGMGRIGTTPDTAPELAVRIEDSPHLHLLGAFTHFPTSDTPAEDAFTDGQIATFTRAVADVQARLGRCLELVHMANSGGVLAHPEAWGTMVRPGIMAYGYYPDATTPRTIDLRPAITWATRISFLKQVPSGGTVGYGRTWAAPRDTWVATIPVGYGDGFDRHLSNVGTVLVGGRRYPIVGSVCMDQSMIDVGPEPVVAVGDEVVLLGRSGELEYTADDMAELLGTISYEVTCAIAPRVARVHIGGGDISRPGAGDRREFEGTDGGEDRSAVPSSL
ncbi:alanine racemase [Mobilicoccus pelagius]|uniref:Alanine racemase n=1 Tax=Mobilicoccus pelagius NBRC 104925 TaxID=1089455 RepID=H5UTK8_9MICO|nr:alanine racemase [Mobilicoccus pelagius]GAB49066.1 alanine racemase [Mobilicoccus pelagius NBRC 104925]